MAFEKGNKLGGRKKGSVSKAKQTLKELITDDMVKKLIKKLVEQALSGSTDANKYLLDQKFGKANQTIDNNLKLDVVTEFIIQKPNENRDKAK